MESQIQKEISLVEKVCEIYHRISKLDTLKPSKDVDNLFTELVGTCIPPFSIDITTLPANVQEIRSKLIRLCGEAEWHLEGHYSTILGSFPNPLHHLNVFPYYSNYLKLSHLEFNILNEHYSALGHAPKRVAFVGSGPLPLTSIILASFYLKDAIFHNYDIDPVANLMASHLVSSDFDLSQRMVFHTANIMDVTNELKGYDVIFLAALVGIDIYEKVKVIDHLAKYMAPGAFLMLRSAHGARVFLYPVVDPQVLQGFQVLSVFHPNDDIINSVVVSHCHIPVNPLHKATEKYSYKYPLDHEYIPLSDSTPMPIYFNPLVTTVEVAGGEQEGNILGLTTLEDKNSNDDEDEDCDSTERGRKGYDQSNFNIGDESLPPSPVVNASTTTHVILSSSSHVASSSSSRIPTVVPIIMVQRAYPESQGVTRPREGDMCDINSDEVVNWDSLDMGYQISSHHKKNRLVDTKTDIVFQGYTYGGCFGGLSHLRHDEGDIGVTPLEPNLQYSDPLSFVGPRTRAGHINMTELEIEVPKGGTDGEGPSVNAWNAIGLDNHFNIDWSLTNKDNILKPNTNFEFINNVVPPTTESYFEGLNDKQMLQLLRIRTVEQLAIMVEVTKRVDQLVEAQKGRAEIEAKLEDAQEIIAKQNELVMKISADDNARQEAYEQRQKIIQAMKADKSAYLGYIVELEGKVKQLEDAWKGDKDKLKEVELKNAQMEKATADLVAQLTQLQGKKNAMESELETAWSSTLKESEQAIIAELEVKMLGGDLSWLMSEGLP